MPSKIILYGMDISSPVRAALLTLHALGIPFEYKVLDLFKGEHLTAEALKHNPQHTVPVLDDNGTWIWDSHVISTYLIDKYGKDDKLYPKDLLQRARVDQRLHFDSSVLYPALRFTVLPMWREGCNQVNKYQSSHIIAAYDLCEAFLAEQPYMVGDHVTVADFCCAANVSSLVGIIPLDVEKYPKTQAWLDRISKLPYYEQANGEGNRKYIAILQSKLTDIQI